MLSPAWPRVGSAGGTGNCSAAPARGDMLAGMGGGVRSCPGCACSPAADSVLTAAVVAAAAAAAVAAAATGFLAAAASSCLW